jgi:uncharacterized protein YkwD
MVKCQVCGIEQLLPFRCNDCGKFFCSNHRLTANHNCKKTSFGLIPFNSDVGKSSNQFLSMSSASKNIVDYALNLVNSDRRTRNMQEVMLSRITSAQQHAQDMLSSHYLSHWNLKGLKPYMRYTLAGGRGAVAENIAFQGIREINSEDDIKQAIKLFEWEMMNDDSKANWGHRDNILNPNHNRMGLGIAFDSHNVFFVQDFEDDYITWKNLIVENEMILMEGNNHKVSSTIKKVDVFFDKPSDLSTQQLWHPPYNSSYDPGTYIGTILPDGWKSCEGITITAIKWIQSQNEFCFEFSLEPLLKRYGDGIYTLYAEDGKSTKESLTSFSVWKTRLNNK